MLQKIHIQNFKSLNEVSLHLQDVNLLIGPNNSGKSNLLKAFEFFGNAFFNDNVVSKKQFQSVHFRTSESSDESKNGIPIVLTLETENILYQLEIYGVQNGKIKGLEFLGKKKNIACNGVVKVANFRNLDEYFSKYIFLKTQLIFPDEKTLFNIIGRSGGHDYAVAYDGKNIEGERMLSFGQLIESTIISSDKELNSFYVNVLHTLNTSVNAINVSNLKQPYPTLENDYYVNSDASNLVAFLDNMRDAYPEVIRKINQNLQECIEEFRTIIFEKVSLSPEHKLRKIYGDKTFKRIGVLDKYGQKYWADELSDGTLYFLALLATIHQPNPPKLLLLEEPENGIHPRRIKEVVDFIFELAESKGVQVIMTTHSTVLIDQFEDLPENIFVFDKNTTYTTIKNLQSDIIAEDKQQSEKLNLPQLDLSGSLGDHWASGLIGGVPK